MGRTESLAAVDTALRSEGKELLVVAQRDARVKTPKLDDLFAVGTRATIKKVTRLPNGPT